MFDQDYSDQVERIGRVGSFAPGSYICKCISCDNTFQGDKRASQCLACTVTALVQIANTTREVLTEHHQWHQQKGLEMKLGDEYFDCESAYCDSSLEEKTTDALGSFIVHAPPASTD